MRAGTRPTPPEPPGSRSVNAGSRTPFRLTDRHPGRSTAAGGRVSPFPRQRRRVAAVSHRKVCPRPLPAIRRPREGPRTDWKFRHPRASVFPCAAGHREKSGGATTRTRTRPLWSCGASGRRSADPGRMGAQINGRTPAGAPLGFRRTEGGRGRTLDRQGARPKPEWGRVAGGTRRRCETPIATAPTKRPSPSPEPNPARPKGPTEFPGSSRHRLDDRSPTRRR